MTGDAAQEYLEDKVRQLKEINGMFRNSKDPVRSVRDLIEIQKETEHKLQELEQEKVKNLKGDIVSKFRERDGINFLSIRIDLPANQVKDLAFELSHAVQNMFLVIASVVDDKPMLTVMISEDLAKSKGLNAGNIVRELARHIQGGGGGQPHFATAGGKDVSGVEKALEAAERWRQMVHG